MTKVNKPARVKVNSARKASYGQGVKPINPLTDIDLQTTPTRAAALSRQWVKVPVSNVTVKQNPGTDKSTSNFRNGTCGKPHPLLAEAGG